MTRADGHELSGPQVIPAALAAGALTPADVVHRGVLVEQVGRSHAVYRVSVAGTPQFFLKTFGPTRGATDGLAARERAVLALARERPAVAALVPPPWPWSPPDGGAFSAAAVTATRAVAGAEAWSMAGAGTPAFATADGWSALVSALVPRLAAFHRATRDLARPGASLADALQAVVPWPLCLMDGDAAAELWHSPLTAGLLREAALDPMLVSGLRAARLAWRPLALIHADLKLDNILVEHTPEGLRPIVVDWEMARLGDPAWDLAGLTAHLAAARSGEAPWPDADLDATALLVRTYAAASGLRAPGLARRQVMYAGAALLMMALQHAAAVPPGSDLAGARSLTMRARATFRSVETLTMTILARVEGRQQ